MIEDAEIVLVGDLSSGVCQPLRASVRSLFRVQRVELVEGDAEVVADEGLLRRTYRPGESFTVLVKGAGKVRVRVVGKSVR